MYLAVTAQGKTAPEQDVQVRTDSYITLGSSVKEEVCNLELEVLKVQLKQAEDTAHRVQREVGPSGPNLKNIFLQIQNHLNQTFVSGEEWF